MAVPTTMDPGSWLVIESEDGDLLREMIKTFAEALMSAEAQALCGAGYGEVSAERTNSRNGYRAREFDTRAGTIELAVPKLRKDSYYPGWLLTPRRRAEQALTQVVGEHQWHYQSIRSGRDKYDLDTPLKILTDDPEVWHPVKEVFERYFPGQQTSGADREGQPARSSSLRAILGLIPMDMPELELDLVQALRGGNQDEPGSR